MNFYELNDPYYALIAAEDKGEAVQLYIANVAGDMEESQEIAEELNEVNRDYVLTKLRRTPGENGENISENDVTEEINSKTSRVILIDGSLI
jgi:hypothetical protein